MHARSVRTKILGGFGVVVAVTILMSALAVNRSSAIASDADEIYQRSVLPLEHLGDLRESVALTRNLLSAMAATPDLSTVDDVVQDMEAQAAAVGDALTAYEDATEADVADQIETFRTKWAEYMELARGQLVPLARAGDHEGWWAARTEIIQIAAVAIDALGEMSSIEVEHSDALKHQADDTAGSTRTLLITVGVAAVALAVVLGELVSKRIARPLKRSVVVLDQVADGDFTQRLDVASQDEVGQLAEALNRTLERTGAAIATMTDSANMLAVSSEELATVSSQLGSAAAMTSENAQSVTSAAEEVSAHVETVAASGEEMGASVREIAANAAEAAAVASSAVSMAEEIKQTMTKLNESSEEIGEVVRLITAVAEQTNLLALNATIEAARAGEAGKGFAVVANEVKDLAKETATATADISDRITAIQADATAAAQAIGEIAAVIERIDDIQATIAAAVEEQAATTSEISRNVVEAASGSSQIAATIASVADATRETSTGSTDVQSAAVELARLADELATLVGQFKVEASTRR